MSLRAAVLSLLVLPGDAQAADPWEVERADMDVATLDAVSAVENCLAVEYRAQAGDYAHCIDYAYASCREWERPKGFRARDCLEQAHHTWRWMVWSLTPKLAERADDASQVADAAAAWETYMQRFCTFGVSTVHPWSDDPRVRREACRTELTARQAVSLWVALAP